MTDLQALPNQGSRVLDLGLWGGAGLIVLGLHLGAAAWYLQPSPVMPANDQPPPAVMIEFAPAPEAMQTEANEITPDQRTAEPQAPAETKQATDDPAPTPPMEETPTPEPAREVAGPQPPEEVAEASVDHAEVPLPQARPKPPETRRTDTRRDARKEQPKQKPVKQRRQQEQDAVKSAVEAKVQVTQSQRNAARQTTSGLFSGMAPAQWRSLLMAHLERRKRYPAGARSRGERGVAYVRFRIDDAGNVLAASLARSSGFAELDQEVLSLVRRASPVPAPPVGVSKTITAPVLFDMR